MLPRQTALPGFFLFNYPKNPTKGTIILPIGYIISSPEVLMKFTLTDRFRYEFDNTMSQGAVPLIAWLFIASSMMILLVAGIIFLSGIAPADGDTHPGYWEIAWHSLMRTLDAGTMGGDSGSWPYLFAMLAVTLGGVFIVSILIGVLTSGIETKLYELRKGRSLVMENGHTVILGWSPQILTILGELVGANANQRRSCIAILADKDKVEMEDEIRQKVKHTGRTRIVCRTGDPLDLTDLEIVSPHNARSIIILSPESEDPDARVIKTILALTNNPNRRQQPYHIVAEIHQPQNLEVARLVGRKEVELLMSDDLIARITAQTCRQSGLSTIYTELLDFGGDEVYIHEEPRLVGKTFGETLLMYPHSSPLGLRFANGSVQLKPPLDTVIQPGDSVIAVTEDDDTLRLPDVPPPPPDLHAIRQSPPAAGKPERTLVLGWNPRGPVIVRELDSYVNPGSEVLVVAENPTVELDLEDLSQTTRNLHLEFSRGDTTQRQTLENLSIGTFDHVIVLSCAEQLGTQAADSRTLITLLHLRSLAEKLDYRFSIVSEMLDMRNRNLAEVTHADDFIVSDQLISLMLAQISESKDLAAVFSSLFDPEGAELYLKPAADYVELECPVHFSTVVESARQRDEIALGFRLARESSSASAMYGVHINPDKRNRVTFAAGDRIVVLAEN
jgi:ion channel POLLUX/CASTOR